MPQEAACFIVNCDDYAYIKVVIDSKTLEFLKQNLHKISPPLNRMTILTQLTEMVNNQNILLFKQLSLSFNFIFFLFK